MATDQDEIKRIRREMARIRRELHEDVRGMVEGAEAVSDWKHYIRRFPWVGIGVAFGVGFLVVPKRRRSTAEVARAVIDELPSPTQVGRRAARGAKSAVESVQTIVPEVPKKKGRGIIKGLIGLAMPIVLKAGQNYAIQFAHNWIAQQQQSQLAKMMAAAGFGPDSGPADGPGGGPEPTTSATGPGAGAGYGRPPGGPGAGFAPSGGAR